MVECKYKNRCTSYSEKCESCANNFGKRDYYQPMPYPWWPAYPIYPWYQQTNIWCTSTTGTQQSDGKCDYYSNNSDVPVTC